MNIDERIGYLLRAAERADREGNVRVARALRRMAWECRPFLDAESSPHPAGA